MQEDQYWGESQADFDQRRRMYLEYCVSQTPDERFSFFSQIARLELGQDVNPDEIHKGIKYADSRRDCCDFTLGALLRIVYRYADSPHISDELIDQIKASFLRFKYWWDEPAGDNRRCYHTENHQILFHTAELLAGQLFPEQPFGNDGRDGRYHVEHALHLIRRWFDFRIRFGFSEWLSNCYFDEDLLALVNLYDFAEQPDIRAMARQMIDVLIFEMAMHSWRGLMGCTHGRTYARLIKGIRTDSSATTIKLMLGMGLYNAPDSLGAIPLATSGYRCPSIFEAVAADLDEPQVFRECHSLNIEDAPSHGLKYDDMLDGYLYWSVQDYLHPNITQLAMATREKFGVNLFEDYSTRYDQILQWQIDRYGKVIDEDVECHAMTEVHCQTWRTGDCMLSCAQDYRPGKPGYQQHIWQAVCGIRPDSDYDAVVFTNHPGKMDETSRPNFWAGNGVMPRAAQHENVLISIHHLPPNDALPFSHAFFPRDSFDEVVERDGWIFGRYDKAYIALFSQHAYQWHNDEQGRTIEIRVDQPDNVWLCEMGDQRQWQSFDKFVDAIAGSSVQCDHLAVHYASPSQAEVHFAWDGPLRIKGEPIELHNYPRFDNPYCQCPRLSPMMTIQRGDEQLTLDFEAATASPAG